MSEKPVLRRRPRRRSPGAENRFDVVLLDYQLPDVHGLSLLSTVRRLSPTSRVILMSAHATPEIANEALALGAARVVAKPIDMRDVPALVHDWQISNPLR